MPAHAHTRTHVPSSSAYWDQPPHILIPFTHKRPLRMPLPQENPTPPPQLSVSAAGLLNWLWSAALGGALLCALPNWSQWRFSRRTLAPVVLCSRAQHSIIFRGSFTRLPMCVYVCVCVYMCVCWGGRPRGHATQRNKAKQQSRSRWDTFFTGWVSSRWVMNYNEVVWLNAFDRLLLTLLLQLCVERYKLFRRLKIKTTIKKQSLRVLGRADSTYSLRYELHHTMKTENTYRLSLFLEPF